MTVGLGGIAFIVALILFVLATVGIPSGRFSLVAAGLAFMAAGHVLA
jgi:hypothetical protein